MSFRVSLYLMGNVPSVRMGVAPVGLLVLAAWVLRDNK
jgi:hypothetical protein